MVDGALHAISGLPPLMLEGVVSQIERRAPQVLAQSVWAVTEIPGGPRLADARMMPGLGGTYVLQRGIWVTPTEVYGGQTEALRGMMLRLFPLVGLMFALLLLVQFVNNPYVLLGGVALVLVALVINMVWARIRFSPGKFGASQLSLAEGAPPFDQVAQGVELALARAGLHVLSTKRSTFLGARSAKWRADHGVALTCSTGLGSPYASLALRTTGVENAEVHRKLKGLLLESLRMAGVGAAIGGGTAPATATPAAQPIDASPWNLSVLPSGAKVADRPFSMIPDQMTNEPGGWMSRSKATDRRLMAVLLPFLGVMFAILFSVMASLFGVPFGASLPFSAVAAAVLVGLTIVAAYPQMKGDAGWAVLTAPGAFAVEESAARAVDRALERLGKRPRVNKSSALWRVWKLDVPVKIRFQETVQTTPARFFVYGRGSDSVETYQRLKGLLLEEVGMVTPVKAALAAGPAAGAHSVLPPPVTQAFPIRTPPGAIASEGALSLPLARPARGSSLVEPADWAHATYPGWPTAEPDVALPTQGVEALAPGWWASAPFEGRGSRTERAAQRLAFLLIGGTMGIVLLSQAVGAGSRRSLASTLVVSGVLAIIVIVVAFATFRSQRKRRKQDYASHARSFLRIRTDGASIAAVAGLVGGAATWAVPTLWPVAPKPGTAAVWREATGNMELVLWLNPGHDPYLEISATGAGTLVSRIKGAVESALFAPRAPAPPTSPQTPRA